MAGEKKLLAINPQLDTLLLFLSAPTSGLRRRKVVMGLPEE